MRRESIQNFENEIYLSVISLWETIIKYQLGKLLLPEPPEIYLPKHRERHFISSLELDETSVSRLKDIPLLHRNPFDHILTCLAIEHDMTLVTVDDLVRSYPVSLLDF